MQNNWTKIDAANEATLPPVGERVLVYVHPDIMQAWRHGERWELGKYSHPIGMASHWCHLSPPGETPTPAAPPVNPPEGATATGEGWHRITSDRASLPPETETVIWLHVRQGCYVDEYMLESAGGCPHAVTEFDYWTRDAVPPIAPPPADESEAKVPG